MRALSEGLILSRTNGEVSKRVLGKYTRVNDESALQGTFDFNRQFFSATLKTEDKSIVNALRFLDQPKAKDVDPKQFYENSLVDQLAR